MSTPAIEELGTLLMQKRFEKNLTQKELGALLGVTDASVNRYERGLGFPVADRQLWTALEEFLELDPDEFLTVMVETSFRVRERRGIE